MNTYPKLPFCPPQVGNPKPRSLLEGLAPEVFLVWLRGFSSTLVRANLGEFKNTYKCSIFANLSATATIYIYVPMTSKDRPEARKPPFKNLFVDSREAYVRSGINSCVSCASEAQSLQQKNRWSESRRQLQ